MDAVADEEHEMQGFDPATSFGAAVAQRYDDQPRGDEADAVAFLADVACGRPALEFAIGTGRIALPLHAAGTVVDGIELSPDMLARLRQKPGGADLALICGNMASATTGRTYGLVYLVFNTIFNLLSADDQIRCFANAARHLDADGCFVVETALPHAWIAPGTADYVHAEQIGLDAITLDVARYDPVSQLLTENHVRISAAGIRLTPIVCRLITPGEMDLMARIAGLRLLARYADWRRGAFDIRSTAHVSVYGF
jgi:SAM-dependent methyltransferase